MLLINRRLVIVIRVAALIALGLHFAALARIVASTASSASDAVVVGTYTIQLR